MLDQGSYKVAFINDTPASLSQMKILGEKLIDVHSQHQNLLLNQEGFDLARRTVAKYREAIGIGSSAQRRRQKKLRGL